MYRFLRLGVIACALLAMRVHAAPTSSRDDATTLREIKQVLWPRAYFTQDTALLDRILADDFQMIDGDGNWSGKSDEIEWISRNKPSYDDLVYTIRRLDIFENGTAIVAGTGTMRGRDNDGPYVIEYQSSNVFIKRHGTWRAVASHVSGARKK
jgi:hypothetical protein